MKVTLEDYKAIQELKAKGYSRNEATERSKYTQYVIYKFWDMSQDDFMDQVGKTKSACVPYRDFFTAELKENPFIPVSVLYDKFVEKVGVKVSQASVYRYVKDLRRRMGLTERQMRLTQIVADQLPGEEAQVDYGESQMLSMYGYSVKVYFFCMVLSHSRMKYDMLTLYEKVDSYNKRKSIVVITNRDFEGWADIFHDEVIATTLLDRLIENCQVIHLTGGSYRLRSHQGIFDTK